MARTRLKARTSAGQVPWVFSIRPHNALRRAVLMSEGAFIQFAASVVRDPKTHPDAIIPDLSKPDPLVKFSKDDIAFVYGSKWKQRYFTKRGDDYYPLGAQWDVSHQVWRAYQAAPGSDWWTAFYPNDNMQRPTV
jgi:hypothetical protein